MNCLIILKGTKPSKKILTEQSEKADLVICADGGAQWAIENGIEMNAIIGDLDSLDEEVVESCAKNNVNIIRAPKEKDETDGVLAVDYAILRGSKSITLLGADGGRLDHQYGNLMLLKRLLERKIENKMIFEDGYAMMRNHKVKISCNKGDTISIVPFEGELVIANASGFEYTINTNTSFAHGYPIGISNIANSQEVLLDITSGNALIFCYNTNK